MCFYLLQKTTLLVLKSNIEVARFQNQAPQYIPISEAFWKALSGLPVVYDYTAYRAIVERFGTHYRSEGSLGGFLKAFMYVSEDRFTASGEEQRGGDFSFRRYYHGPIKEGFYQGHSAKLMQSRLL